MKLHLILEFRLLDIIFCEFYDTETYKITENYNWCGLVKRNEELVTRPYHEKINSFSNSANYKSGYLIRDFLYGN